EEVDLVDVEDAAVRLGEQARLERLLALPQRARDVDRPGDAILGRVQRQVDDAATATGDRQLLTARAARGTHIGRIAGKRTVGDDVDLRQQLRQPPHGRRLPGPGWADDQHAADRRVHGVEQERPLETLLLDDRGERKEPQAHVMTSRFPNVGSACTIGGNCQVPISGTAVSRLTLTSRRYGLPAFRAVSNASARSPGWSIEIAP